jgi:hypothetical protein
LAINLYPDAGYFALFSGKDLYYTGINGIFFPHPEKNSR